jgi:potassium/chloride transporter 9
VKVGNLDDVDQDEDPAVAETPHWWQLIDHLKVKAFVEITVANTIREGIQQVPISPVSVSINVCPSLTAKL